MAKGAQYERDVCKQLSLWWSNGKRDDLFWRTSGSGARATVRAKIGKHTVNNYGDIRAESKLGRRLTRYCIIEVKRGYSRQNSTISDLLDSKKSLLREWILKIQNEASKAKVYFWFIILKRDRKKPIILCPYDDSVTNHWENYTSSVQVNDLFHPTTFCTTLEEFLKANRPEDVHRNLMSRHRFFQENT